MTDQLQSVAIYLSKSYPLAAIPQVIEKLQPSYPKLALLLQNEYNHLLPLSLSEHQQQQLQGMFPSFFLVQKQVISLRECYTYPQMPPALLHYLEQLYTQQHGTEQAYRQVEIALSRIRCWDALRDYYLRYLRRNLYPHATYQETRHKALLLCLRLAPHPTHALQLLLDWLNYPHPPHPTQLGYAILCFDSYGWHEHLIRLLEAIATQELQTHVAEQYQLWLESLRIRVSTQKSAIQDDETTPVGQELQGMQHPDRLEARRLLRQAAQGYATQPSQHEQTIRCWQLLVQENPGDPNTWYDLYATLLPSQQWSILDGVLSRLALSWFPLPTSPHLLPLLLQGLRQNLLPHIDPLPFMLQVWQKQPHNHEWFTQVRDLFIERGQWVVLRQVLQTHVASLEDPLHVQEVLLEHLQQYEQHSLPVEQWLPIGLMAFTFHSKNRALLTKMIHWSLEHPDDHYGLHRILHALAQEGFGSQAFQLQCPSPEAKTETTSSSPSYERMLQHNPHHVEVIHRLRQSALHQRDFGKVLNLYEQELEVQTTSPIRAFLLRSMGEILHGYLRRSQDALTHLRAAQPLMPPDPDLLLSLAEIYEHLQEYRSLVEILQALFPLLPSPQHHPPLLRKLVHISLHPLQDYATATKALSTLLLYHPPVTHSLDLIHKMVQIPAARIPLLTLLYEREKDLPGAELPYIQLEICRNLFLQQRDGDARDRLQTLVETPGIPDELAQQAEDLAAEYAAWPELVISLQRRIQRLEQSPSPHVSPGDLHLQLGNLLEREQPHSEQSLLHYRRAFLFSPQDLLLFERLRSQLYQRGAFAELRMLLHKQAPHVLNHKTAAAMYTQLAMLEHHLHRRQEAMLHLQQAHRLDRESPYIAQLLLAWSQ